MRKEMKSVRFLDLGWETLFGGRPSTVQGHPSESSSVWIQRSMDLCIQRPPLQRSVSGAIYFTHELMQTCAR